MRRVLFYLPNITPWWFDNIVAPLIRTLAAAHEVHVMVPPLWGSTGIEPHQLGPFIDVPGVAWHILDGDDHPALRAGVAGHDEVVDLVRAIGADHVLCRCADPDVVRLFPGTVRYIMEGVAPPLWTEPKTIIFTERLFEYGAMPPLADDDGHDLDRRFADVWSRFEAGMRRRVVPSWRERAGIAPDRKVIAVPLEYEFADGFIRPHRAFPDNCALIEAAARVGDDIFLAVTNHPLNDLYVDNSAVEAAVAGLGDRAAIIRFDDPNVNATEAVAHDCDGAITDLSKCYLAYAYFGVPIARPSTFATAAWLNAQASIDALAATVRSGTARPPCAEATRRWFAYHVANSTMHLCSRDPAADEIIDRLDRPCDPARWGRNIARFDRLMQARVDA